MVKSFDAVLESSMSTLKTTNGKVLKIRYLKVQTVRYLKTANGKGMMKLTVTGNIWHSLTEDFVTLSVKIHKIFFK